jgi:hypothetical protein
VQYMMLLSHPPGSGPQEGTPEFDAEMKRWGEIIEESKRAGVYVAASGLQVDAVTTVRTPGDKLAVTDGPYAEAKEILFSFYIVDVPDLDAATEWAAKMPSSEYGSTEIWPMIDALPKS